MIGKFHRASDSMAKYRICRDDEKPEYRKSRQAQDEPSSKTNDQKNAKAMITLDLQESMSSTKPRPRDLHEIRVRNATFAACRPKLSLGT